MALLNCPYCDQEAEMQVSPRIPASKGFDYTPRCKDPHCCGRINKKFPSKKLAEEAWNKRAPVISDEEIWDDLK